MNRNLYIITFLLLWFNQNAIAQYYHLSEDSLHSVLKTCTDSKEKVLVLKELAFHSKNSNPVDALVYVEEALGLAIEIEFEKGKSEAYHTKGLIQFYLGDYDVALNNYLLALEIREKLKDDLGLGRSYNNIGLIYQNLGEFDLAADYYEKGLSKFRTIKDSIGSIYSWNNLGTIYLAQGNSDKAINNYKIGLEIAKKIDDKKGQAFTHEFLGEVYAKKQDYKQALFHYNETLELRQLLNDSYEIARSYAAIGDISCRKGHFEESLLFLSNGLAIAEDLKAKPLLKNIYKSFGKTYSMQGDFAKAYFYQSKYIEIRDSLINKDISTEILGLQANYEFEKKERLLLEQENEIAYLHRSIATGAFILFLIFVGVLYIRYRKQLKVNQHLKSARDEIIQKNEQLAAYTKELEQFTYIASHDLKEPLRNISGFAGLLDKRYRNVLDANGQRYLSFIMSGVTQMTDLLKDLLQYSEVKRLKTADLQWIDLKDLVVEIKSNLNGQLSKNNGQLMIGELPMIHSNAFQMTQLFKNLITNGLKFQKEDELPIVEVMSEFKEDFWEFRVQDNGIGIDKNYHDKIFEMFKRLHKRQDYEGTGMGLAICKQIVEQHGGKIKVESEKGQGTTFIFTFPQSLVRRMEPLN